MNISEVSAAGKKAAERDKGNDKGNIDIAAIAGNMAVGGMDFAVAEEGRCGSSGLAICAT